MTSIARALRITSGSLGVAVLVLTAGPHSAALAQHGAQIEKSCVNAARRACLQGTTPGCPGVNAGVTCQTAADCPPRTVCLGGPNAGGGPSGAESCASDRDCDNPVGVPNGICTATLCVGGPNGGLRCTTADQCPGGECTSCVPIPIANLGDPVACTITVTSVDPVDRIRLDTVTDEISSRSPIVPTANLLPGFGFCRFSPAPGVTGRMCIMNEDCTGSSCSTGSTCMGGTQAGLPCPTRADCPDGTCFNCAGGGVCQVSPHCELAPTQLCMSQDDCAPASGACVVVLGQASDAVNVPFHPHCSTTASVFCMTDIECRPPMCPTCGPTETCVSQDLTVLASDTNPLTDLARTSGIDEGTLQPVTLTFPGNVCIPPVTCEQTFPTCNGPCPSGQTCVVVGGSCVCQTPCENSAPTCNGTCPTGQTCASTPTGCVCQTPCENSAPTCNGTCPTGQTCASTPTGCVCQTPCANSAPTCNGTCPTGQTCASTPTGCVCQTPCEISGAPACNGTCPPGQICSPSGSTCQCTTPVCDSAGPCSLDIDGQPCLSCASLGDAVAVVARTNTSASAPTRTITVHGRCTGDPVVIRGLFNLVVTGDPPANTSFAGCSGDKGPQPGTLTSTVARKPPPFVTPSGSNGEVLKVIGSSRVTIKYLNIRDGHNPQHSDDGVDFKTSTAGRLFCNCITNNEEGADIDAGSCNQFVKNLVISNQNGIRASSGTKFDLFQDNTSKNNNLPIIDTPSDPAGRHNGMIISESSASNNLIGNVSMGNPDDGFKINIGSSNCVVNNSITGNGGDPNASVPPDTGACELVSATNNRVDGNQMSGNVTRAGQPSDVCRLISGTGNCGSNIPGAPACAGGATCPSLASQCTVAPLQ